MQAIFKRDSNISHGSTKFCCPAHDGLRKTHKRAANRRFRHNGKAMSHDPDTSG